MNLFQTGLFTLSCGAASRLKIDCDTLADDDIATLAWMVRELAGPFSAVEGVPRGGLRLAAALQAHRTASGPLLLVDDVLTTGASLERMAKAADTNWLMTGRDDLKPVKGAVLFARGPCPPWVKAVCQLPECFWPTATVDGS